MKAFELLEKPGAWTRNALARNAAGEPVTPYGQGAVCWCVVGAVLKCYENTDFALQSLNERVGMVVAWNNDPRRTQAEVVAVLKELDL